VEMFRGDTARGLFLDGRLSTSQIIAIPAALAAAAMLYVLPRRSGGDAARPRG